MLKKKMLSGDPEFLLSATKTKAFRLCRPHLNASLYRIDAHGSVFVKLRWELLVQLGTKRQLAQFDKMRLRYINDLLERHCTPLLECDTTIIGSRSPKSNVDINMTCPTHMEEVLHKIFQEQEQRFPGISMEELFDVNIYGSVFHYLDDRCDVRRMTMACYPRYEIGYRQRMWSFLRIVEMCERELTKSERTAIVTEWPVGYQQLYADTRALYQQHKRHKHSDYIRAISKYMKELARPDPDPRKIAEAFSRSKVIEHDTYRSIGAVLHIVEQRSNLHPSALYDSCYDNIGFIFQVFLKPSLCGAGNSLTNKLIKSAKYIERVFDAVCRINGKKNSVASKFVELNAVSAEINRMRKALARIDEMRPLIVNMTEIIVGTGDILPSADTVRVLRALTMLILTELKKDTTLNQPAKT